MSSDVAVLFEKQARLFQELQSVTQELANLVAGAGRAKGSGPRSATTSKRKSWFKRGEAVMLFKKHATKPLAQADLVRAVLAAKGYDKGLSAADRKRVTSATYQAIANAVVGKALVVGRDGMVVSKAH
jgi:hypothetical protein